MPVLILQFLLGMFANLFITFPTTTTRDPLTAIFTGGSLVLILHILIGTALLILSLLVLIFAPATGVRRLIAITSIGFIFMALAFFAGLAFVLSYYQANALSYLMAVGFLFVLIIYGALAGQGKGRPANHETTISKPKPVPQAVAPRVLREDNAW